MEMATAPALFLVKNGADGLLDSSPLYLTHDESTDDPRFEVSIKGLADMEIGYSDDITEDLNACVGRLRERGLNKVITEFDLTKAGTGHRHGAGRWSRAHIPLLLRPDAQG